jgi:FkbM family methyltransferase
MNKTNPFSRGFFRFLESVQPIIVDVGARGGGDPDLLPYAGACRMIGFEPEPLEAKRLMEQKDLRWGSYLIIPNAVGSIDRQMTLHLPASEEGGSLYPHNEHMLDLFGYGNLHKTVRTINVQTLTLESVSRQYDLSYIDYLKVDAEGAELDILRSMGKMIGNCFAIKVEVSFLEQRQNQSLAWQVMEYLNQHGFYLADIKSLQQWRRRPIPGHPYLARHLMPYSKGLCAQCDLVFLKDVTAIKNDEEGLRLSCMASLLGFFDYAITVLRERKEIATKVLETYGIDLEKEFQKMSKAIGRKTALSTLIGNLRQCIPLIRSLMGGLPTSVNEPTF